MSSIEIKKTFINPPHPPPTHPWWTLKIVFDVSIFIVLVLCEIFVYESIQKRSLFSPASSGLLMDCNIWNVLIGLHWEGSVKRGSDSEPMTYLEDKKLSRVPKWALKRSSVCCIDRNQCGAHGVSFPVISGITSCWSCKDPKWPLYSECCIHGKSVTLLTQWWIFLEIQALPVLLLNTQPWYPHL